MDRFGYGLRRTVGPASEVISLADAKTNCRIDTSDHDDHLNQLIAQARNYCEEQTNVALLPQTWELKCDAFPCKEWLELPRWPLVSIDSVTYYRPNDEQGSPTGALNSADIVTRIDDHGRGRMALAGWDAWPQIKSTPDAVTITFTAGFANVASVPPVWVKAQLMLIAWWFEQLEAGTYENARKVPLGIEDLLANAATVDSFEEFEI